MFNNFGYIRRSSFSWNFQQFCVFFLMKFVIFNQNKTTQALVDRGSFKTNYELNDFQTKYIKQG